MPTKKKKLNKKNMNISTFKKKRKYRTLRKNKRNKKYKSRRKKGGAVQPVEVEAVATESVEAVATEPVEAVATEDQPKVMKSNNLLNINPVTKNLEKWKRKEEEGEEERKKAKKERLKKKEKEKADKLAIVESIKIKHKAYFDNFSNDEKVKKKGLIIKDKVEVESQNETLGSGGFGNVFKVQFNQKKYALKLFRPSDTLKQKMVGMKILSDTKEIDTVMYLKRLEEIFYKSNPDDFNLKDLEECQKNELSRLKLLEREVNALLHLGVYGRYGYELKEINEEGSERANIVILQGLFFAENNIFGGYFMELCSFSLDICHFNVNGELTKPSEKVGKDEKFSGFKEYMKQTLNGLNYMHRLGLVHLDLFPRNILYNLEISKFKICDFGFTGKKDDKIRDLFSGNEIIVIPNYHMPEFYKKESLIEEKYDYYTFGISTYLNLIKKIDLKETFPSIASLITKQNYKQIMDFPTEKDLERSQQNFESYQKDILDEIEKTKHYFPKFSKNNSRNTDLKENVQTNVHKTIGEILSDLINGTKVKYNDDRFEEI